MDSGSCCYFGACVTALLGIDGATLTVTLRKNIVLIAIVGLAIAIFATGAWRMAISDGKWHQPYFPPRENADGTMDYTLFVKTRKEFPGGVWVLRIPKVVDVQLSENEGESSVMFGGGGGVGFSAVPNGHIVVNFDLDATRPFTKDEFPIKQKKVKHIRVSAYAGLGEMSRDDLKQQEASAAHCKNGSEVAQGVIDLDPQKMANDEAGEHCRLLNNDNGKTFGFAVRNEAGKFVTLVDCSTATDDHIDATCTATLHFPWYRRAFVSFSLDEVTPDKFREVFQKIAIYFEQATVRIGTVPPDKNYTPDLALEPN